MLPPKGHTPTAQEISFLDSVDPRIPGNGGTSAVGVPIVTREYVLERALGIERDAGTGRPAHNVADMPDRQIVALITVEPLGPTAIFPWKGSEHGAVLRNMQEGRQRDTVGIPENPQAAGSGRG